MNVKSLELLNILKSQDDWITSSQLSLKLNVSLRSIKNYTSEIKKINPNLIITSRNGYKVNKSELEIFLKSINSLIPQTAEERIDYLIIKLIKNTGKYINIYDISQEIFISESTLKSDLKKVKQKLYEFDLTLIVNGDNISLKGLEKNKRKIMNSIIYSKLIQNPMNISTIQDAFKDYNIEQIENIIINTFKKYQHFINEYSLINMILHVTITIDRLKNNCFFDYIEEKSKLIIKKHEYEIACDIAEELENIYNIKFNESELYELSLLIISSAISLNYRDLDKIKLEQIVGKECIEFVIELIHDINDYYYIDIDDPEFLIRFAIHIKNLLIRAKGNRFSKNPLTDSIKNSYPLIYDCAVNISFKIKNYANLEINEDEIAYIALHIGAALINKNNLQTKITCAILFPQYYDLDAKFSESLSSAFSDTLLIKYIATKETELKNIQIDFVISTIRLINYIHLPYVIVSPFLTEKDRKLISNKIDDIKKSKQKLQFLYYLHSFFKDSLFRKDIYFENEIQAIEYICNEMQKQNYIDSNFMQEVFEREAMSSTAFNGIAIPHSMNMNAIKTGMFVIVNKHPVIWGKQQVNIIILLAINKNEKKLFHEMFDSLAMVLSDEINLKRLINCNSFQEFINTLADCI